MFIYLFFLKIRPGDSWQFYTGLICYILGLCLCTAAMVNFSFPDETGFNRRGLYRFSRNPMYVAYFICFAGMAFLTRSGILLGLVILFQISAHWIILAEERWCIRKFGDRYREYMIPGAKGLSSYELAHKWAQDLGTRLDMSMKVG